MDAKTQADFKKLGYAVAAQPDEMIEIMPNNWESFTAFIACQTQWRMLAGMAGVVWTGLDYPSCKLVLDDRKAKRGVFADVRRMESAALPILNEVR